MTQYCSVHPTQPAWWHCPRCEKNLCPQCIDHRKGGYQGSEDLFFCSTCNVKADQLDPAQFLQPFWNRLHKIFIYPFSSLSALGLILGLAFLATLFNGRGLIAVILQFVFWAVMLKYSYEALRWTSQGRISPPPFTAQVVSDNFGIVFKQIGLFIALFVIFSIFIVHMGPVFWILYGIVILVGLPAMIIILAVNDSLLQALNPVYFLGMAWRIGWPYLLMLFFLSLLIGAPSALGYAVIRFMPESLQVFLWLAAKNYYTLVSYHLMGYVILQYHDRLNYSVDIENLLSSTFPASPPQGAGGQDDMSSPEKALLKEINPLIQDGNLDGAIARIQEQTRLDIQDGELSERYANLLKMRQRHEDLAAYAPHHLDLLVHKGEKAKATTFFLDCAQSKLSISLSPVVFLKIASWFNEQGKADVAVHTLNQLVKHHPQDDLVPKAYYRAAQILHERLMNTEKAKKILQGLIAKYPDHDIVEFARKYLADL